MTSSFFFSSSFSFSCMPLESESETETETEGNRGALSWPNYRVTRCWLKWPERRAFFDDIWIWLEPEGSSSSLFVLVRPSLQLDVGWRAASTQPLHHHSTTMAPLSHRRHRCRPNSQEQTTRDPPLCTVVLYGINISTQYYWFVFAMPLRN